MIIYIEKEIKNLDIVKRIIKKFHTIPWKYKKATIIFIDNYKNIFTKNIPQNSNKNSFILAKLKTWWISDAPKWYWHNDATSYFLKTSINCIFDCSYCFLKWAFKNDIPIYFLNYDDIKKEILEKINSLNSLENIKYQYGEISNKKSDYELKLKINKDYKNKIWFYSGDYSDILGMDNIWEFIKEFVLFFENINNVMMEIRTKSSNIKPILDLSIIPKNTEFAFSLNPQVLIEKYENKTSSLNDRIKAINILIEKGYNVWLRFLPLLPVKDYKEIYYKFIKYIKSQIDIKKISSTFVSWLLYTKSDYNNMLKKYPKLDILYKLKEEKDWFIREDREMRDFFYNLFKSLDEKCFICLDEK